uniref:Uncharacterized protein n=1 Tax=Eutreptiella gymnastica TaxID=73025 RepID=A0A6U8M0W2_9EUGL|mmetsp:Transcript_80770/g.142269  ORF Transcript_80770/g.142269 Transcript_80770/m.142269 type:complete len:250 (+) Transcript_80770:35-784(+)
MSVETEPTAANTANIVTSASPEGAEVTASPARNTKAKPTWKETMAKQAERRQKKYAERFPDGPDSKAAWVKLNNEFICHATKQIFTTAVQVRDHCKTAEYKQQVAANSLEENMELIHSCELHAKAEKEAIQASNQQKLALQQKTQQEDLITTRQQVQAAAKQNRMMAHENAQLQHKINRLVRQITHAKSRATQMMEKRNTKEATRGRQAMAEIVEQNTQLKAEKQALQLELEALKKGYTDQTGKPAPTM